MITNPKNLMIKNLVIFYRQLDSTSKKLSTFSKKIGKSIEDLEIDDLVLLVEQR